MREEAPGKQSVEEECGLRGTSYFDLLPSHDLHLTFLPQGKLSLDHFGPIGVGQLEVLPILHNFCYSFDVLPFLDVVIRQTWWKSFEI